MSFYYYVNCNRNVLKKNLVPVNLTNGLRDFFLVLLLVKFFSKLE